MSLNDLALKHNTDKRMNRHGYVYAYEKMFKGMDIESFLEIGIYHVGSHKMWLDYFPEATVYGIDIDEVPLRRARELSEPRLVVDKVDSSDRKRLTSYAKEKGVEFDVVIDDGAHVMSHQIAAFEALWPFVSKNGLYIVEDCFTSYWADSPRGYVDQELTAVDYFKGLVDKVNLMAIDAARRSINRGYADFFRIKDILKEDMDFIARTVESITFRNGLIVIKKWEV